MGSVLYCTALHCSALGDLEDHVALKITERESYDLTWVGAHSNLGYMAGIYRFLYMMRLSNTFRVYHRITSCTWISGSSVDVGHGQNFGWTIFCIVSMCCEGSRVLRGRVLSTCPCARRFKNATSIQMGLIKSLGVVDQGFVPLWILDQSRRSIRDPGNGW